MKGAAPAESRHVAAALTLCEEGRFGEAAVALDAERRRGGEEPWVLGALALLCREQGASAQALGWAERALRRGADVAVGHAEAGLALSALGRRDAAAGALARGLHAPLPHRNDVALCLAEVWFDAGEPERAERLLRAESRQASWDPHARADAEALAAACRALRRSARGGLPAVDGSPGPPPAYGPATAERMLRAAGIGRADLAQRLSLRILRTAAEDADALAAVAMLRARQGLFAEADRFFGESLFRGPRRPDDVLLEHARLLARMNRLAEAAQALGRLSLDALPPQATALFAEVLRRLGHGEAAAEAARRCLARAPRDGLARAVLWRSEGDGARVALAERALAETPGEAALLFFLADAHRAGRPEHAAALAGRALALDPLLPGAADWAPVTEARAGRAGMAPKPATDTLFPTGLFAPRSDAGSAWPTDAQTDLLRLAFRRSDAGTAIAAWTRWCAENDVRDLDAGSYRLLPLVLRRLLDAGAGTFPHRDLLTGIWRKAQIETVDRLRKSLPALDALLAAGIPVMPLKGLLFAHALYPDAGSRPMSDLDLLVRDRDAERAHAILTGAGLRARTPFTPALKHFHYATTLREPSGGHVDLHWRPLEEAVSASYADDLVWADAVPLSILGRRLWRADWTFQLFHAVVHGTAWNPIAPVRWAADAALILARHGRDIDWTRLDGLAQTLACRLPLRRGLAYLAGTIPAARAAIPDAALTAVADPDEAVLLPRRSRPSRTPCGPDEILALIRRYAPLVQRFDGALLAVIGGRPAEAIRAACADAGVAWFPTGEPNETGTALRARDVAVAFCIDGEMNGGYVILTRA